MVHVINSAGHGPLFCSALHVYWHLILRSTETIQDIWAHTDMNWRVISYWTRTLKFISHMNYLYHIQAPTLYHNVPSVHLHIIVMNLVGAWELYPKPFKNQSGLPVSKINHRCWWLSDWKPTAGNCLGTLVHVRQIGQGSNKRLVFCTESPCSGCSAWARVDFWGWLWAVLGNA